MKKLIFLFAFCLTVVLSQTAVAQVRLSVNIATQPIWGPVGYDHVEYYYLPDIDSYYWVPEHKYIYHESGHWISRSTLPQRYRNYDMYRSRKVVINDKRPYLRNQEYRRKYADATERSDQQSIRDSDDSRYFVNRNHPEHSKWKESQRNHESQRNQGNRNQGNVNRNHDLK
jgi:hypothetical protein